MSAAVACVPQTKFVVILNVRTVVRNVACGQVFVADRDDFNFLHWRGFWQGSSFILVFSYWSRLNHRK